MDAIVDQLWDEWKLGQEEGPTVKEIVVWANKKIAKLKQDKLKNATTRERTLK